MSQFEVFGYTCASRPVPGERVAEDLFPTARTPTVEVSVPGARLFISVFQGGLGPRLRAAARRRERSPHCAVALLV